MVDTYLDEELDIRSQTDDEETEEELAPGEEELAPGEEEFEGDDLDEEID